MLKCSKKLLLTSAIFDTTVGAWFTTWWVAVFIKMINQQMVSTRVVVEAIVGLIISFIIVKHIKIPSIKSIMIVDAFAYLNLLLLWISVDAFYVFGGIFSALVGYLIMSFNSALLAQNIRKPQERVDFDNKYNFIKTIGSIVGGSISFFLLLNYIDFKLIWVVIYVLCDIDLFLRIILIKTNRLHYRMKMEND